MKKKLFACVAAVLTLLSACQEAEEVALSPDGSTTTVSFTADLEQALKTRAVAGETNGTQATTLTVAVYNASNQEIAAIRQVKANAFDASLQTTVSFQLVKGQTYSFAFWAQNPSATEGAVVFEPTTGKVSVDYTKIKANDETLDAFTAHVNNLTVSGPVSKDITLLRPWAQLNYGATTADVKGASLAGIEITKSKVVVNNVYKTLNLLDGTVDKETIADVELAVSDIPTAQNRFDVVVDNAATPTTKKYGKLHVGNDDYVYIGLNYLLVGGEADPQSLIKADLEVYQGDTRVNAIAFSNVPVQRNYRTNIVGNLLTSQVEFQTIIDPMYEDEYTLSVWEGGVEKPETADATDNNIYITSAEELAWVSQEVANGNTFAGKTLKMTKNIDLNNKAWTPIGSNADDAAHDFQGTFDGQGNTISNLNVDLTATPAYRSAGLFGAVSGSAVLKNFTVANATVKNITSGSATDNGTAIVAGSFTYSGGGTIENVTVKNATVEGNRYVGGIAGYFAGTVKDCVVDGITLTATPDNLTGSYDNGDKVGGIVGYSNSGDNVINTITNNTVKDFTIKAYRDMGGILGYGNLTTTTVTSNKATDGTLIIDQLTNNYGVKTANANAVVGRIGGGTLDVSNTSTDVVVNELVAAGISRSGNSYIVDSEATANTAIATIYTNAKNNSITDFTINLPEGNFVLSSIAQQNITIRIAGTGEDTKLSVAGASQAYYGCTVDFSDLMLIGDTDADFVKNHGLFHLAKESYTNVTFTLFRFFYAPECTLNNCKFIQDTYNYSFCSYGTTTMVLNDCEMSCVGKAAKIYGVDSSNQATVTFNRCKFTCDGSARQTAGKDWKAAIEIDARATNNTPFTVNINNTVGCTGFYTSENTGIAKTDANYQGTLYNVDNGSGAKIVVNIDGTQETQAW